MKNNYSKYIQSTGLGILFAFATFIVSAQTINTTIDKKDILIGEHISYNIKIDLPSPEYKIFIQIPDSIPHFDFIERGVATLNIKEGRNIWEQKVVFTSFDSGTFNLSAFACTISHATLAPKTLFTDSFKINIGYMPTDSSGKPRDIKTIIEVEYFNWLWVIVAASILIFLLILFFVIRYLRKQKKQLPAIQSYQAYKEAIKSLDVLRKANEEGTISTKEYHSKLAEVLKVYYSRASKQNILNKTTEEILDKLKFHALKAETASTTLEALQTGDAAKFAKYNPSFAENELALNYLRNTIEEIEKLRHQKK
jgi:uncharacterized membrane protein